jgi:hypothetical protein
MMSPGRRHLVTWLLIALAALDLGYAITVFGWPSFWMERIHGVDYGDPTGLLRRTGALWAAFALLQGVAAARWRRRPHWLMLVAGARLTELVADWVYLGFADHATTSSSILLAASPILNLACVALFYATYFKALDDR